MNESLRRAFESEMEQARARLGDGRYAESLLHLERAHILGQRWVVPHVRTHWWMLRVGWGARSASEVIGQIARLTLAGPGSLVGRIPLGNPGTTRVGIFKPVEIPPDLDRLLRGG
jgi:hypothetical protein